MESYVNEFVEFVELLGLPSYYVNELLRRCNDAVLQDVMLPFSICMLHRYVEKHLLSSFFYLILDPFHMPTAQTFNLTSKFKVPFNFFIVEDAKTVNNSDWPASAFH